MTVLDKPVEPEWSDRPAEAGESAAAGGAQASASARRHAPLLLTVGLVVALLILVPVAGGLGAYPIPTGDVISSVVHRIGLGGAELERVPESVLWNVRFPRIVLALPIGASLGCAGAQMGRAPWAPQPHADE